MQTPVSLKPSFNDCRSIVPRVLALVRDGYTQQEIADTLTADGYRTHRGGPIHQVWVSRLLRDIERQTRPEATPQPIEPTLAGKPSLADAKPELPATLQPCGVPSESTEGDFGSLLHLLCEKKEREDERLRQFFETSPSAIMDRQLLEIAQQKQQERDAMLNAAIEAMNSQ
ncbi:hypothetical protein [Roseimaritima ulvae]|uniref:Uncharacterized protein n=1 Tax=Roseimaritima ulvae TaxID=980254 RepID=A0A5B9QY87_9BACT|nr:hypothetical protein [Roseimaritima ulvae]QEG42086.1 hypothetical protein UC8_41160 [Roseimaritima ulvae]